MGEGSGLMRWAMSGMLMVSGEIWGWTGLTGDSGTFLGSFLSLDRAVNVIFILVLGNRKQHLKAKEERCKETVLKLQNEYLFTCKYQESTLEMQHLLQCHRTDR